MKLNVTPEGLASFEEDEPAGFITPRDRNELNRRRAKAQSLVACRESGGAQNEPAESVVQNAEFLSDEELKRARLATLDELTAQAQELNMGY